MISDYIRDNGVNAVVSDCDEIHFCSQDPTTYAEATATYTLAVKTSPSVSVGDGTVSGRSAFVAVFSNGTTTGAGNATHYAAVDTVNSRLLATGALSNAPVAVTTGSGETAEITSQIEINIPD